MHLDLRYTVVIRALGVIAAGFALFSARTAQGATAWGIALVAYPYVALPLYAIFGFDRFNGYVRARRFGDAKLQLMLEAFASQLKSQPLVEDATHHELRVFEGLAGFGFTRGNTPTLLIDGKATFAAIIREIEAANCHVLVEFYIIRDDALGRRLLTALTAACNRGLAVYFLYDDFGSHALGSDYRRALDLAGIRHGAFRSTRGPRSRIQSNFRNHRKIVVVDGRVAFVGGHNVGAEYLEIDPKVGAWRDTHVRLEGAVALQAQLAFTEDWYWTKGEVPDSLSWRIPEAPADPALALILATGPVDDMVNCAAMYVQAITSARERFWLATPYFVPDLSMITVIRLACLRGVDVRFLVTKKSDSLLLDLASTAYLTDVLRAGARVFSYSAGFMHQKVFLVDSALAAVTSANFDVRSFRLNFEVSALVKDGVFATAVATMLEDDMARSEEVRLDHYLLMAFPRRMLTRAARLLTPVI